MGINRNRLDFAGKPSAERDETGLLSAAGPRPFHFRRAIVARLGCLKMNNVLPHM
jgi:hypothetical protein